MRGHLFCAAFTAAIILIALPADAQEKRIALVIGNAAYNEAPLKNPVNDARAITSTLRKLGFEVIARENATRNQLGQAIVEFGRKLDASSAALVFYAGHGIQSRGRNYLIPVDAALNAESDLRYQAVDVTGLLEEIEQAQSRVGFVILDACRNNPFERRLRGAAQTSGLAAIDAARGLMIAYATSPGSVASDGDGSNGTYTAALLKALAQPGLKAEEVFKRVRVEVADATGNKQTPWESSSLTGDFVFNITVNVVPAVNATPPSTDREALFWQSMQSNARVADYEAYLAQFPNGTFAALARNRLEDLGKPQLDATSTPSAPIDGTPGTTGLAAPPQNATVTSLEVGSRCDGTYKGYLLEVRFGTSSEYALHWTVTRGRLVGTWKDSMRIERPISGSVDTACQINSGAVATTTPPLLITGSVTTGNFERAGAGLKSSYTMNRVQ